MLIRLRGELDLATAPLLAATLSQANSEIVVDLAGLAFLDASGLGVLARASTNAERHGNHLSVVNADSLTQEIFELTGLHPLLSESDIV